MSSPLNISLDTLLKEMAELTSQIEKLQREKMQLEIALETVTEHADLFQTQLLETQNTLEQKVLERTKELAEKNKQLQGEIYERKRAETELLHAKNAAEQARIIAEMANRAKSLFLAKMSHELRTPLNAILGYSDIIYEDAKELNCLEIIEDIENVKTAGEHLLKLISDILDTSKIETGTIQLYFTEFSIIDLLQKVETIIRPMLGNNTLKIEIPAQIGTMIADEMRLQQILQNLLSNAVRFTDKGKISVSIKAKNQYITFRIRDTGIGIPTDKLKEIFEAFSQVDNSFSRKYDGAGLGLTICQQLCYLMDGKIRVKSKVGKGSIFILRLPRRPISY